MYFVNCSFFRTRRLPVLHVFGKWPISIQHCSEQFQQMFPDPCVKVLVFCDVMYSHCIGRYSLTLCLPYILWNVVYVLGLICSCRYRWGFPVLIRIRVKLQVTGVLVRRKTNNIESSNLKLEWLKCSVTKATFEK